MGWLQDARSSFSPIRQLKPTTSAARMAASLPRGVESGMRGFQARKGQGPQLFFLVLESERKQELG